MAQEKWLHEGLKQAFEEQRDCDVKFSVEEKIIGAHRLILSTQCQVLYDLSTDWTPEKDPIVIEDISYDSFKAFVRYMYSGVPITDDNVFPFLSASIQFKMEYLEELCAERIIKSIGNENVCAFMEEAINFKSAVAQIKCCEVFSEQTAQVMKTNSFKKISQPTLSAFLDVEETNILEITMFMQIANWMKQKCKDQGLAVNGANMRHVIGDALYKIRFPIMTNQDFANSVSTIKGLLNESEMLQVFQKISVFDSKEIDCPFSSKFRCKFSQYHVPFEEMVYLLDARILHDNLRNQPGNLQETFQGLKNTIEYDHMNLKALRVVLQCCADLANTAGVRWNASSHNWDIRTELNSDFNNWYEMAQSKNVKDIMTKYMEMRTKLDKLVKWSFR